MQTQTGDNVKIPTLPRLAVQQKQMHTFARNEIQSLLNNCTSEIEILKVMNDADAQLPADGPWSYKNNKKMKVIYKHKAETENNDLMEIRLDRLLKRGFKM